MKLFKLRANIALLISLLIVLVLSFHSFLAIQSFDDYKKVVNPKLELTVDRFKFFFKNEIKKEWIKLVESEALKDNNSALKTFRLSIEQADINSLNSDLPRSGKDHYIKAYLKTSDDKKIRKVKLRYRGDQINHWLFTQKSLRIKLANDDVYNMHKKFNLINPPMITSIIDVINYKEAKTLGLISPDFYPVRVFINAKYMGVYFFLSQIDESLMRKFKKMPGSIYRGDYGVNNYADKNGVSNLWSNVKAWEKVAARNAEQKNNNDDINYFIKNVNSDSKSFYDFFNNYLNTKKYYNYFALDVVFGTNHHDYAHNHYLYFDPYKGLYEPIEWDLRFWLPIKNKDGSIYPLLNQVRLNPILEYNRDLVTYKLLNNENLFINAILKKLDKLNIDILSDLSSDIHRDILKKVDNEIMYSVPFSLNQYFKSTNNIKIVLQKRRDNLIHIYNDITLKYIFNKKNNNTILKFSIDGNTPVKFIFKENIKIFRDINFNAILDDDDIEIVDNDILYPGRKWKKGSPNNWPVFQYGDKHLINSNLNYQYIIISNNTSIKDFIFQNAITNNKIDAKQTKINNDLHTDSIHPWKLLKPKSKTRILTGTIEVNKTLVFDKNTEVTIKPNTTFIMDENVSIYFYGKVTAIGTKEKPIKFIPKDNLKPWGLVAVQGKTTTGSKFHYCHFENGSVDTKNLIHYTSQFNIHDMDYFEVKNCFIGKNHKGDDAMHIAYAKGVVDNCIFDGARSDGLDIDISDVNVTNNIFKNSGNDGLDVMTTTMNASNNTFIDTGDKGISVGEWSSATITDSTFTRTVIGLEVKDKSQVKASNLKFIDSKDKAINLYNKNKRYDTGGFLKATNIEFIGNDKVKADKRSKVTINE